MGVLQSSDNVTVGDRPLLISNVLKSLSAAFYRCYCATLSVTASTSLTWPVPHKVCCRYTSQPSKRKNILLPQFHPSILPIVRSRATAGHLCRITQMNVVL